MANYKTQMQTIGFGYDELTATGYNKINNIGFVVRVNPSAKEYTVSAACKPQDESLSGNLSAALQQFAAQRQNMLKTAMFDGKQIHICYQLGFTSDITQGVNDAVNTIVYYVNQFGCVPCCSVCGKISYVDIYSIENNVSALCPDCFGACQRNIAGNIMTDAQTVTNYPMGILGAMLGGLIGAVLWLLFSAMDRVTFLPGLVAGICGIIFFKKMGKKMSKGALAVAVILSFAVYIAGMYLSMGIDVYNVFQEAGYDITFTQACELIPEFLTDSKVVGNAIHDFGLFGILPFIASAALGCAQVWQEGKVRNRAMRLM